ncbi:MAG TPA: hypothetical protein VFI37_08965 [Gaiellaceae bacterium]|nr:hypothetical protein [Gaiellaceae bacterium]
MRLLTLLGIVLAVGVPPGWHTFSADGVHVRYPHGWHATAAQLTPVDYPAQALAVASFPLPHSTRGSNGCSPQQVLKRMPATGAFVFGWEYARPSPSGRVRTRDFPPRPKHFRLGSRERYKCLGPSYMLRFREAGRFFQVHVALGPRASPAIRATVLRVLDSFRAR